MKRRHGKEQARFPDAEDHDEQGTDVESAEAVQPQAAPRQIPHELRPSCVIPRTAWVSYRTVSASPARCATRRPARSTSTRWHRAAISSRSAELITTPQPPCAAARI